MSCELEVTQGIEALEPFAGWNELVASSATGSFFQSAEWIAAWWHELVGRPELAVARVRVDGRVVAGAALARVRTPLLGRLGIAVTTVVNAGSGVGAADHGGFPVVHGSPAEALDVLWEWVQGWHGNDPLLLRSLSPEAAVTPRAVATLKAVDDERCPRAIVPPGTDFDAITAAWSKNRRKTIGKKLREFSARGGHFEWIDDPDHLGALLPTVFGLHQARRADQGKSTRFGHDEASRRFHQRLVAGSAPTGGCWLQLATVDGEAVGALYGFRFGAVYSVYQSGWDPRFHDVSLGLIQYAAAFRNVVEQQGRVFDMCRGDDPYKLRFATETTCEVTYTRASGLSGQFMAQRLRFDAYRRARRRRTSARDELVDVT